MKKKHHLCCICHEEAQVVRQGKWLCLGHQTHRLLIKGKFFEPAKNHCAVCGGITILQKECDGCYYCPSHSAGVCTVCGRPAKIINEDKWYCEEHHDQLMQGAKFLEE